MTTGTSKKFKVEVIADSSGQWCGNGLTFETKEKAEEYARDLWSRWTLVRQWRVVEIPEVFGCTCGREMPLSERDEHIATCKGGAE